MTRRTAVWVAVLVAAAWGLAAPRAALAREGDEERDRPPARKRDVDPGAQEREERAAVQKQAAMILKRLKAGEEVTEEERKILRNAQRMRIRDATQRVAEDRDRRARRPARGLAVRMPLDAERRPKTALRHDERLNVIDAAYYQIAELHLAKKHYKEAVATLEQLIKKSPDKRSVSLTHLNLAGLYRKQLGNPEKAVEEYKKVTGEFAIDAQRLLAQLFEELDQLDEAIEQFESLAKNAQDNVQKVLALRQLAELLAKNGRHGEAIAALQRLITSMSYEEAAKISKTLLEERLRREKREQEEQERARTRMRRVLQQRWRARKPNVGPEMQPIQVRPREPKKDKRQARPIERPIKPRPDAE